jgi:formyl-CoA transferase
VIKRFSEIPGIEQDVPLVRAGFRLASGDPEPQLPPPALGAHTDAVLKDLGYTHAEIAQLREEGAI